MSNRKKILIGVLIVFFLSLLYFLWFFFFQTKFSENIKNEESSITTTSGFPTSPVVETPNRPTLLSPNEFNDDVITDPVIPVEVIIQKPKTISQLTKVFEGPTAGFFVPANNSPIVVFKRGDGERYVINKKTYEIKKTIGPEVPKTVRAFPLVNNSVVIQQQDTITPTFLNTIFFKKYVEGNKGILIGSRVRITPNPNGSAFLYSKETQNGIETKTIDLIQNTLFSFNNPFFSWSTRWDMNNPTLLTRPHNGVDGFFYSLEKDGTLTKHLGPLPGLSALFEESTNTLLFSTNNERFIQTTLWNKNSKNVFPLEQKTLVEKCVLSSITILCGIPKTTPRDTLPEAWYQGQVSFDDNLVEFYPTSGRVKRIFENNSGESIDVIEGVIVENLFVFINKKDLSLWALRLSE